MSAFPSPAGPSLPHFVQYIKDIKRSLQIMSIVNDGLLVVQCHDPLSASREYIIDPRQALDCLLMALHVQLSHPLSPVEDGCQMPSVCP